MSERGRTNDHMVDLMRTIVHNQEQGQPEGQGDNPFDPANFGNSKSDESNTEAPHEE